MLPLPILLKCQPPIRMAYTQNLRSWRHELQEFRVVPLILVWLACNNHGAPIIRRKMSDKSERPVRARAALRREHVRNHNDGSCQAIRE